MLNFWPFPAALNTHYTCSYNAYMCKARIIYLKSINGHRKTGWGIGVASIELSGTYNWVVMHRGVLYKQRHYQQGNKLASSELNGFHFQNKWTQHSTFEAIRDMADQKRKGKREKERTWLLFDLPEEEKTTRQKCSLHSVREAWSVWYMHVIEVKGTPFLLFWCKINTRETLS